MPVFSLLGKAVLQSLSGWAKTTTRHPNTEDMGDCLLTWETGVVYIHNPSIKFQAAWAAARWFQGQSRGF